MLKNFTNPELELICFILTEIPVSCSLEFLAGRIFYKDYEGDNIFGGETGERVSDMQAFCGRKALKNPSILWKADYSAYLNDFLQSAYPVSRYKWVSSILT